MIILEVVAICSVSIILANVAIAYAPSVFRSLRKAAGIGIHKITTGANTPSEYVLNIISFLSDLAKSQKINNLQQISKLVNGQIMNFDIPTTKIYTKIPGSNIEIGIQTIFTYDNELAGFEFYTTGYLYSTKEEYQKMLDYIRSIEIGINASIQSDQ